MERRITEEQLTKAILVWLEKNGWKIISFDFPQSGTGVSLHPNQDLRTTKNKGDIIPDIVATKGGVVVFFENKDRFVLNDFIKVEDMRRTTNYANSIENLMKDFSYSEMYYGVGLPLTAESEKKTMENIDKIDFAVFVSFDSIISVPYQIASIFS